MAIVSTGSLVSFRHELVGNIPTEEVIRALETRGVPQPIGQGLEKVEALNKQISREFA